MKRFSYLHMVSTLGFLVLGILIGIIGLNLINDAKYDSDNRSKASEWDGITGWLRGVYEEELVIGASPYIYNQIYSNKDRKYYWELDTTDAMGYVLTESNKVGGKARKTKATNITGYGLEHIYTFGYPCCGIRPYSDSQYISSEIYIAAWSPDIQNDDSIIAEWSVNKQDWNYITNINDTSDPDNIPNQPNTYGTSSIRVYDLPRELIQEPADPDAKFYLRFRDTNRTANDTEPGELYVNYLQIKVKINYPTQL